VLDGGLVRKYTPTPTTTSMTTIIAARTIVRLFGFGPSAGFGVCCIFFSRKSVASGVLAIKLVFGIYIQFADAFCPGHNRLNSGPKV
jgi:hypothetical protein